MTEPEWLICTEAGPMLGFVADKFGERKARLFAAACCRQVWKLLRDEASRKAVEVAERFADGEASKSQLRKAAREARTVAGLLEIEAEVTMRLPLYARRDAARASALVAESSVAPFLVAARARDAIASSPHPSPYQCSILRCLCGPLPFRDVAIEPEWLSWGDGTIPDLARSIDRGRDFDRLPYLGDALEEAGCVADDILDHCRLRGEHFPGCWVIDSLLGRGMA